MCDYLQRIRAILSEPLPLKVDEKGRSRNELVPRNLPLSRAAKNLWIRFHDATEIKLGDGGELAAISGFAAKAAEHAARIAGVLTLVDDLKALEIDLDHISHGIELTDFYLTEVLRIHDTHTVDPDIPLAEKLLSWAQQHEHVYLRQIYRLGPNAIREAKTAKRIARVLEDHGWFLPVDGGMDLDGAHRRDVWLVRRATDEVL